MSESKASSAPASKRWILLLFIVAGAAVPLWWYWPVLYPHFQSVLGTYLPSQTGPAAGQTAPNGPPSGPRAGGPGGPPGGPGGRGGFNTPTPVRVTAVEQGPFEVFYKALGTVTPLNVVNVRTRVAGELVKINFTEGQKVKTGDLLAVIDPRPYQIALKQAQGTLAQNQALLRNAQLNVNRYRKLHAEDSIAKQTLDTQEAEASQYQGMIAANQAAVDEARLNLDYTQIRAPIEGRLGLRQLDIGNLLSANDTTALVVITQTQPTNIEFTLPEGDLMPVISRFRQGEQLVVQAWDRSERMLLGEGVLQSLDNQIDITTGTLRLKGRFANEQEMLLPNQFINVRLRVEKLDQATLIPSAAIQYGSQGTFVYVVNGRDEVELRVLDLGASDGARTVVKQGIQPGERVVVEGTERLKLGNKVEVVGDTANPSAAPSAAQANAPAGQESGQHRPRAEGAASGERPAR